MSGAGQEDVFQRCLHRAETGQGHLLALGKVQEGDQGRLRVGRAQLEGLMAVTIAQLGGDYALQTLQVVASDASPARRRALSRLRRACWINARGVSQATTRPRSMMAMRSHNCSASSI